MSFIFEVVFCFKVILSIPSSSQRPHIFSELSDYDSSISYRLFFRQLQTMASAEAEIKDNYGGEPIRSLTETVSCRTFSDCHANLTIITFLKFYWMFLISCVVQVLLSIRFFETSYISKVNISRVVWIPLIASQLQVPQFTVDFEVNILWHKSRPCKSCCLTYRFFQI